MKFLDFFEFIGRRFDLPLRDACRYSSFSYNSAKLALCPSTQSDPKKREKRPVPFSCKRKGGRWFVSIDDLYLHLYPCEVVSFDKKKYPTDLKTVPAGSGKRRRGRPPKALLARDGGAK